jgi:acyl carrier protein
MANDTFERVRQRLASRLKIDPGTIGADHRLDALGVDSLTALELVFDLEEDFKLSIPNEQERAFATVRDVCDAIDTLRAQA